MWFGIVDTHVIGPFFFKTTVNGERYKYLLENMVFPIVNNIDPAGSLYFQQDGAPPHFTLAVRECLNENFPERWIGRGGPILWSPRSPDLNPLDYFVWGFLKDKVYGSKINSFDHLIERITEETSNLQAEHLSNTLDNFKKRIGLCYTENGQHFEHLL